MRTVTVTGLAQALNLSRPHVSRKYKRWGFVRVPWSTEQRPRFLVEDIKLFNRGGTEALQRKYPVPMTLEEANRRAQEAADQAASPQSSTGANFK